MSWLDKIKTDFTITTGDGKTYTPLYRNPQGGKDYNVAEFEFPAVKGTLVYRGTAKGRRYPLEFYFQGENHLDDFTAFERSADDSRPWVISHPYYGRLTVQPTGLYFDNTGDNLTKVTCTVVETITTNYPRTTRTPVDVITLQTQTANALLATSYSNNISPKQSDITQIQKTNRKLFEDANKFVDQLNAESYFNAFNESTAAIDNATQAPLTAMRKMQAVVNKPAQFVNNVVTRFRLLKTTFDTLRATVTGGGLTVITLGAKLLYQAQAGTAISGMLFNAATPLTPYGNRNSVLDMVEDLQQVYAQYLADLNSLQGLNAGAPGVFMPDAEALRALGELYNYAISNLFVIALNSKQERSIITEDDTNWIQLTHRFYGLDTTDANITALMQQNNAGLNNILLIRKGTRIFYYV